MKIFVKTLKGSSFEIEVEPQHKIVDVKRNIEASQGKSVYPAEQQMLIHSGKVLNDDTTLEENEVKESSFLVIMLSKAKGSSSGTSTTIKAPSNPVPPTNTAIAAPSVPAVVPSPAPAVVPSPAPAATVTSVPPSAPTPTVTAVPPTSATEDADAYGQAASSLVSGNNLEQTVQQLLDMGGGTWDRDTVSRALRAAFNNPERAVEYLYSGIPENVEAPPVVQTPVVGANSPVQVPQPVQPPVPSSGPNANPLDLFPQGLPNAGSNASAGSLDLLRNNPQFRALQNLVQANPQVLQPMLQELARQNPQVMRLIQEHQGEFLRLINEPAEGTESNLLGEDFAAGMPAAIELTPEEHEAIERLEGMGFDRALVLEVFIACNRNEQLAANYLLDHMHEFEE